MRRVSDTTSVIFPRAMAVWTLVEMRDLKLGPRNFSAWNFTPETA
jgi:hypothetical protein